MSYLARLKAETRPPKELPKPPKATYGSNDSTHSGHVSEIETELRLLVPAVVRASDDDAEMEAYCLKIALADPVDAVTSYRLMATELDMKSGNDGAPVGQPISKTVEKKI